MSASERLLVPSPERGKRSGIGICLLAGLFLLLSASLATAQNVGSIYGEVADVSGGVILNAKVTVVSPERGLERSVSTNESGQFVLPALPVGTYTLSATAAGFQTCTQTGIVLDADTNVRISCKLRPGQVTETITVESGAVEIDLRSATVGTLVENRLVQDIPLADRSVVGLAQTLPGVVDVQAPATFTGDRSGPTYSTAGARMAANLFLFDGVMYNNLFRNTGLNYPPPDAIQEVRVLLNNYGAEYGRNTGSVFNAITKSGTNKLHGSAWEYARNSAFNARNWYDKYVASQTPGAVAQVEKLVQNQFGATLGGPVIKDKLFFFTSYQGLRLGANTSDSTAMTPTAAELTGDFSDLWRAGVAGGTIDTTKNPIDHWLKNPMTGSNSGAMSEILPMPCQTALLAADPTSTGYLPGARIPAVCMNPVVHNLVTKYLPINPNAGAQVVTTGPSPKTDDNGFFRLDYNRGKHTIDARYNLINADDVVVSTKTAAVTSYQQLKDWARSQLFTVNDTYVVNANVLNTVRAAYRVFSTYSYPMDSTTASDLGMNFPVFGTRALPVITVGSYLALSDKNYTWGHAVNKSMEFSDSLSWTRGKHVFQFGGTYLRLNYRNDSDGDTQGYFHVSTAGTGNALADFLIGDLNGSSAVEFTTSQLHQGGIQNNFFWYAKDDWRLTPRLSLSLGVRYELPLPWYEPNNYWGTFIPGRQSQVMPAAPVGMLFPGDPGIPRGIVQTPKKQFMPRVGFAYDVFGNGNTALRGGFGMFYNATNANIIQNGNQPWRCLYSEDTVAYFSDPLASIRYGICDPKNPTFFGQQTVTYPQANFKPSYAMAFNLGIQQALPQRVIMEVNYVGKLGRHEMVFYQANPAIYIPSLSSANNTEDRRMYPGYGDNATIASSGTSNYNSLQVQVSRRMSRSLTVSGSYTWGRSIDISSAEYRGQLSESPRIPYVWELASERGPSDFNATHVANVTWVYDLPRVPVSNGFLRTVANGWSYGGMFAYRSGKPVDITNGGDVAFSGTNDQRPVFMGDWRMPGDRSEIDKVMAWFNNTSCTQPAEGSTGPVACPGGAFEKPAPGQWGNVSRNSVIGPPQVTNNMYISKAISLGESMKLQFRCEAFGVFNTPQFQNPTGGMGSNWGRITSTKGERNLQLSLKLKF